MELYRYFMPGKDIFAGISDLGITSLHDIDKFRKLLPKNYDRQYIQQRVKTEKILYDLFKAKGGAPEKKYPYYLTLGRCDEWFFERKHFYGSIVFDLQEFDMETVSFTYGDSIPTFMEEFDDGKEYRKNIYTLNEMKLLIQKYGYPQQWNTFAEHGPENYIEAQVWSERPIIKFRQCGYSGNDGIITCVPLIASRMLRTKGIRESEQRNYNECIKVARNSPWWNWFGECIKRANPKWFQTNWIHGISHSYKCALMALVLASYEGLDEMYTKTLVLAALYHDIGRNYYDNGRSHGQISADIVTEYIDSTEHIHWESLISAIRFHDVPKEFSGRDTLQQLKDIDTLDYLRLGFGKYNFGFLRTTEAKKMIRFALELNIYNYINGNLILDLIGEG